jgi:hypothetical protein
MGSRTSWWARKARQFGTHLTARVSTGERRAVAAWTRPAELAFFDGMHVADRRHGLDVVAGLRRAGVTDRDVLVAGLLHDCAKGDAGVLPRVAWSLGELSGPWVVGAARRVPGWAPQLDRLARHAEASAEALAAIGLSERAVELVRHQDDPIDPEYGRAFRAADEAA